MEKKKIELVILEKNSIDTRIAELKCIAAGGFDSIVKFADPLSALEYLEGLHAGKDHRDSRHVHTVLLADPLTVNEHSEDCTAYINMFSLDVMLNTTIVFLTCSINMKYREWADTFRPAIIKDYLTKPIQNEDFAAILSTCARQN